MTVTALRDKVKALVGVAGTPALLCITGASGSGKTAVVRALSEQIESHVLPALCFDSLGVPTADAMHAGWESPRGWQKAMTWHWVQTARNVYRTHPLVLLEGQFDPQYAIAACSAHRLRHAVVLLHAGDGVRRERLAGRGQPELATSDMDHWASYLHETTQQLGGLVVDASRTLEDVIAAICARGVALVDEREDPATQRSRTPTRPRRIN